MSLSDKYKASVEQDEKRIKEKDDLLNKLRVFENCGLGKAEVLLNHRLDNQPLLLPQKAQDLIKEAIPLINYDKWKSAKMVFTNNDVIYDEVDLHYVITRLVNGGFVKYKWPDGSIHLGSFILESYKSERGYFNPLKKAKSSTPRFIEGINKKRAQLVPYLIGKQRYVFLDFYFEGPGDDYYTAHVKYILFEDGYLFEYESVSYARAIIDDQRIFGSNGKGSLLLEDWLINNIKKINGGEY